jgi:Ni,Fe-hydrogenase III small subunit
MAWRGFLRTLWRGPASEPAPPPQDVTVLALMQQLDAAAQTRLGRSLALRHLDAGSCNGCELELHALGNILYDLERFGLRFVSSPRHADVLMVTGPLTRNLHEALARTWAAMPDPKWVVAVGDCAVDGGVFKGSYAIGPSPVAFDLAIPGCPPDPVALLAGLLALLAAQQRRPLAAGA